MDGVSIHTLVPNYEDQKSIITYYLREKPNESAHHLLLAR